MLKGMPNPVAEITPAVSPAPAREHTPAPRVYNERVAIAFTLLVVPAGLCSRDHIRLALDSAGAQQDLPVRLA